MIITTQVVYLFYSFIVFGIGAGVGWGTAYGLGLTERQQGFAAGVTGFLLMSVLVPVTAIVDAVL